MKQREVKGLAKSHTANIKWQRQESNCKVWSKVRALLHYQQFTDLVTDLVTMRSKNVTVPILKALWV